MKLLGKHHVRASFYHFISLIFVTSTVLWYFDVISDKASFIITAVLFITDYIAEMYDPHPDSPGPWFKRHFHRLLDNSECEDRCETTKFFEGCEKVEIKMERHT